MLEDEKQTQEEINRANRDRILLAQDALKSENAAAAEKYKRQKQFNEALAAQGIRLSDIGKIEKEYAEAQKKKESAHMRLVAL